MMGRGETGETRNKILIFMKSWPRLTPMPLNRIVDNLDGKTQNISGRLDDLQREGHVQRCDDDFGGGWELTERGKEQGARLEERYGKWPHPIRTESGRSSLPRTTRLTHTGGVRAGEAELFESDTEATFECGHDPDTHVAMKVLSESMEHRRIFKGDTIIVRLMRPSQQISPGEIAVIRVPLGTNIEGEDVDQDLKTAALEDTNPDAPPLDGITLKEWTGSELKGKNGRRTPFHMEPYGIVISVIRDLTGGFSTEI